MKKQFYSCAALFVGMAATTLGGGVLILQHHQEQAQAASLGGQTPAQATAALKEIATADSFDPQSGEWRGLCKENSIHSVADLRRTIDADPTLKAHYSDLNLDIAKVDWSVEPTRAVVYHRKGDVLAPTSRAITLPAGDKYITDGYTRVRMHCCNEFIPVPPTATPPVYVPPAPPVEVFVPPTFGPPAETPPSLTYFGTPNTITGGHRRGGATTTNHTTETVLIKDQTKDDVAPVPEPDTLLLFGAGLGLLSFFGRRR